MRVSSLLFLLHSAFPDGLYPDKRCCKHCGYYTAFVSPNEGLAYLNSNNCQVCGRGYPMPSWQWDTEEGLRYMYERGSVSEPQFYREFEANHPGYPRSEAAQAVLAKRCWSRRNEVAFCDCKSDRSRDAVLGARPPRLRLLRALGVPAGPRETCAD